MSDIRFRAPQSALDPSLADTPRSRRQHATLLLLLPACMLGYDFLDEHLRFLAMQVVVKPMIAEETLTAA